MILEELAYLEGVQVTVCVLLGDGMCCGGLQLERDQKQGAAEEVSLPLHGNEGVTGTDVYQTANVPSYVLGSV